LLLPGAVFFNVADERDKSPDHFASDLKALIDLVADKQLAPGGYYYSPYPM